MPKAIERSYSDESLDSKVPAAAAAPATSPPPPKTTPSLPASQRDPTRRRPYKRPRRRSSKQFSPSAHPVHNPGDAPFLHLALPELNSALGGAISLHPVHNTNPGHASLRQEEPQQLRHTSPHPTPLRLNPEQEPSSPAFRL